MAKLITINDFYEERKTPISSDYSYKNSAQEQQKTLNKYISGIRLKKLKEEGHFREEWLEPSTKAKT